MENPRSSRKSTVSVYAETRQLDCALTLSRLSFQPLRRPIHSLTSVSSYRERSFLFLAAIGDATASAKKPRADTVLNSVSEICVARNCFFAMFRASFQIVWQQDCKAIKTFATRSIASKEDRMRIYLNWKEVAANFLKGEVEDVSVLMLM